MSMPASFILSTFADLIYIECGEFGASQNAFCVEMRVLHTRILDPFYVQRCVPFVAAKQCPCTGACNPCLHSLNHLCCRTNDRAGRSRRVWCAIPLAFDSRATPCSPCMSYHGSKAWHVFAGALCRSHSDVHVPLHQRPLDRECDSSTMLSNGLSRSLFVISERDSPTTHVSSKTETGRATDRSMPGHHE